MFWDKKLRRWAEAVRARADLPARLVLWNGEQFDFGRFEQPRVTLTVRSASALPLLLDPSLDHLGQAYVKGQIDIDGRLPDIIDFGYALARRMSKTQGAGKGPGRLALAARAARRFRHSRSTDRESIQYHYDVSDDFYRLWLDEGMVYSCAYFENGDEDLATAQRKKLDHILTKIRLQPGQRLLDIGCGWGALVMHAARHYGVKATGITLSERQLALARERIEAAGLQAQVEVRLCDYRDMTGQFDKISSVGMFEHVGLKNLPTYFNSVHRLLKPAGLFLNHGITHEEDGWGQDTLSSRFINRYVFPDGELDRASNVMRVMEQERFELHDVESLRMHYARTLRAWVARLEAGHDQALQYVDEAHYRIWRLYMAASALEFETGELGLYQILASRRDGGPAPVPLTRRYMYEPR